MGESWAIGSMYQIPHQTTVGNAWVTLVPCSLDNSTTQVRPAGDSVVVLFSFERGRAPQLELEPEPALLWAVLRG